MLNHIIKICGIRDAEMATLAAEEGANLIGIIFHSSSPRNVSLEQAINISNAAKKARALPVAVFTNQTDIEMRAICEATNIQIVQLHGTTARAHHHFLPKEFQRIYVLNMTEQGELLTDSGLEYLDPARDMILIDHPEAGSGKMINYKKFNYPFQFPWLLAGGLTPNNVAMMIDKLRPNGVDVSSGVEVSRGHKDISLIKQFIKEVRGYHES